MGVKMSKNKPTITSLKGVYASGIAAGIKANGKRDLAYIFVPNAFGSAGVFTRSAFSAPPLKVTKEALKRGTLKAVIINSGNANAGTGQLGYKDAQETATIAAKLLGIKPSQVGVSSTGIIGRPLQMKAVKSGLEKLLSDPTTRDGTAAAEAIMTTDLTRKEVFCVGKVGGKKISIAGFAKGSGMIAPNMATMLGFLVTDGRISNVNLQRLLRTATDATFNMTSVDTDTSTNDMVLAFSTGETGRAITGTKELKEFLALLTKACGQLARLIAADGEGATKLIEVTVEGARNLREARVIAKNIINSPLVKTAIHGADPNWGRVLAAAGKDPSAKVDPERVDLTFAGAPVMRRGKIVAHSRDKIRKLMSAKEVKIHLNLGLGKSAATAWGCDLTHGYVDINVSYN
jgi:glutamate N-acetyltransferase/amino-acid N-acetyltransferase